jgi:hypothetical protein
MYAAAAMHAAPPRVWGYKQCMEIDSQFFWSGAPWDMVGAAAAAAAANSITPAVQCVHMCVH